ncbi:MAG: hypothetical protein NZ609_13765 [Acidimicrobiales bacterium]|nr:hypothetical protein [Acidimicrobiales bacterium]
MNGCRLAAMVGSVLLLFGCASTKVLDEPTFPPEGNPLAVARDQTTAATLDWVIVRNGPGTWSKNADWDQYLLRIENRSKAALVLDETFLEDSTGTKVYPELGRQALRTGSKQVAKRYKDADVRVKAGTGTAVMAATVIGTTVVGGYFAVAGVGIAAFSSWLGLSTSFGAAVTTAGAALIVAGPAIVISHWRHRREVDAKIQEFRADLPYSIAPGVVERVVFFFPITPSPRRLVLGYSQGGAVQTLRLDTSKSLDGLHLGGATLQ